jgi:hypothetical protein
MIDVRPTPNEAMEALEKLAEKMIGLYETDKDYNWGGDKDAEPDWFHLFTLFEWATGFDLDDEENPKFDEFRESRLKATEAEIVTAILRLAKQVKAELEKAKDSQNENKI